ncbi:Tetratricopeptide repeat protein [Posidoniimonas corsicana]|uniref:Tetratricopeptide repeat protein n=1 Tax=Posidoniimonas corsicana TaxID=1938618 RepID=A0A5C5V6J9_9BACT|nr:tetratricopeptide repeat protein [Posidoniimonas corsicana]TWT33881.1 Tetratricopeptide repeat protein [Posidoniimonas corsicana]
MQTLKWFSLRSSPRQKAKWHYRRGMARAKLHQRALAIEDYRMVIQMDGVPPELVAMALYNRALVRLAMGEQDQAIGDLKGVLAMPGAAVRVKTEARRKLLRMDRATERINPEA